ncbi:phage tail assembly protein [Altererythrobacter fulvus]|uniref:phage tail assembly protein n=1 Tax=Caenibius fulvus TaxID=2126012 RepID=UPI003016D291
MADQSAPPARKFSDPITLSEPIQRGDEKIAAIVLRKPRTGELRGLSMQDLMNARVSAVLDVLPRIATPPITQAEADALDPADAAACAGAIIDFFLTPADRQKVEAVLKS